MSARDAGGAFEAAQLRAGRLGGAAYAFALCLGCLAAVGLVGLLLRQPYLFPSLGPAAMLFFETPTQDAAAPRNTLVGHGVAVAAGYGCLLASGSPTTRAIRPAPRTGDRPGPRPGGQGAAEARLNAAARTPTGPETG